MRKMMLILSMTMAILAMLASNALAFHDHGVARCSGCHTMHNSEDGAHVDTAHAGGNSFLLIRSTPSDVCLTCHAVGHGDEWAGTPAVPPAQHGAGSFIFATAPNVNDGRNGNLAANWIPGYKAAHNIVAPSMGGAADPVLLTAPGGTFPSSQLGCTSCHNPHGRTSFRMLNGTGDIQAGTYHFDNAAPIADGISYSATESRTSHTAYKSGMSEWCANCHGDFHSNAAGNTNIVHPTGISLGSTIATAYGLYNGTGAAAGNPATSYIPEVPFEDPANTTTSTAGPTATSKVACITCHRAHASSEPNIGRWDFNLTTLTTDGAASGTYAVNPYPTAPGTGDLPGQRSLCNKCHDKDN
jgi:hypothetical protein